MMLLIDRLMYRSMYKQSCFGFLVNVLTRWSFTHWSKLDPNQCWVAFLGLALRLVMHRSFEFEVLGARSAKMSASS